MTEMALGILSAVSGLVVALVSIIQSNRVIALRIDQLERKVDKHNEIVERTYKLESDVDWLKEEVQK